MMVVIMVSRRVGQVTLAVSLRTSCRNLNGLKTIVCFASVVERFAGIQKARKRPTLISKVSRNAGSIVRGCQSRAGDPKTGRQQVAAMYCAVNARSSRATGARDEMAQKPARKPSSAEWLDSRAGPAGRRAPAVAANFR